MRPRAEGCLALSGPLESRASNNRVHRAGGGGGVPLQAGAQVHAYFLGVSQGPSGLESPQGVAERPGSLMLACLVPWGKPFPGRKGNHPSPPPTQGPCV